MTEWLTAFEQRPRDFAKGQLDFPIGSWTQLNGTALALYSAAPTPGYHAGTENGGIQWGAHATPTPIKATARVPRDLDSSQNATLHFVAAKTGATLADAVTWKVEAFNNVDAALYDADSDFGGTSSAMTGDATAKTVQEETLTLAAADLVKAPSNITLTVQPTDGTLGTDDVILFSVWLEYAKSTGLLDQDLYCCPIMVPYAHRLVSAQFYLTGMKYSGTLVAKLLKRDRNDARGGGQIGVAYDNAAFGDTISGVWTPYDITLKVEDTAKAPAFRTYMLFFSGTDPEDRVDEPMLKLGVLRT